MMDMKSLNIMLKPVTQLACPKNISNMWSFGSLLGLCLATQVVTGLFLAMYYTASIQMAFDSAVYISRNVNNGWYIRMIHANGASLFFVLLYLHTGRGLYYNSYKLKEVWMVGVTLLFVTIITAFLGYVLPWGQMSYWAATVITSLLSALPYLGSSLVKFIWGGFSIGNATLVRFYAFHFLFPFVIMALSLIHIFFLHKTGSSNPLGSSTKNQVVMFHPYFTVKDLIGVLWVWLALGIMVLFFPYSMIDPENFIPANPLVTPVHIQPEWYFLPMYAVLRSIPNKLGGVVALILSIAVLYILPFSNKMDYCSSVTNPLFKVYFWLIVMTFIILMWIGGKPVEYPYEPIGQTFTVLYFFLFFLYGLDTKYYNICWGNLMK